MTTLAIPCALRNVKKQNRKLAGQCGSRFIRHPDLIAIAERPTALAWTSLFSRISAHSQPGA